jgi:cytochrome c oxidase subunit 3
VGPLGIKLVVPEGVPFINTLALVLSSIAVTVAHQKVAAKSYTGALVAMGITFILASVFLLIQAMEYYHATFTIRDREIGGCFFLITGFHGLHVFLGFCFLVIRTQMLGAGSLTTVQNSFFTLRVIYYHFVDVVWLILVVLIYVCGISLRRTGVCCSPCVLLLLTLLVSLIVAPKLERIV